VLVLEGLELGSGTLELELVADGLGSREVLAVGDGVRLTLRVAVGVLLPLRVALGVLLPLRVVLLVDVPLDDGVRLTDAPDAEDDGVEVGDGAAAAAEGELVADRDLRRCTCCSRRNRAPTSASAVLSSGRSACATWPAAAADGDAASLPAPLPAGIGDSMVVSPTPANTYLLLPLGDSDGVGVDEGDGASSAISNRTPL
jgi:hypothetical protein